MTLASLSKIKVLGKITESGLVCVIRAESPEQAERIADACALGGVAALEITFTVPGASGAIEHLAKKFAEKFCSARARFSIRKPRASRSWQARNL